MKKVIIGLSGGIDSSVSAILLKEQDVDVHGVTMKIWGDEYDIKEGASHGCFGPGEEEDIEIARNICARFDIPYYVVDLKAEFKERVIEYFRKEYLSGRTPNPCIVCNSSLKFGFLIDESRKLIGDFDYFATGHYVRTGFSRENVVLKKGIDQRKDQSYFLYNIDREILEKLMFPLGEMNKSEVRALARKYGLINAENPESQDFISGGEYLSLFKKDEMKSGFIIDDDGSVLGRHSGIINYTIGQRKGIGLSSEKPLYVRGIDAEKNCITVSGKENMYSSGAIVKNINWLIKNSMEKKIECGVKIRQNHRETRCTVEFSDNVGKVIFSEPQLAVTPGQSAVFYDGDIVLGWGLIDDRID